MLSVATHRRLLPAVIVATGLLVSASGTRADTRPPTGDQVVVRRSDSLGDALVAALRPAFPDKGAARPVTLVVDSTPYVAAAEDALLLALLHAAKRFDAQTRWRIARLGERASRAVKAPAALAAGLAPVLRDDAWATNTLAALRATIATVPDERPVVVYLADWHFENDHDLEGLVAALNERGATLSIVGPEAAFGQAWNDGFFPPDRLAPGNPGGLYDPRIGRDPFGTGDTEAPWHGGDTAYPHFPGRWYHRRWAARFPVERPVPLAPGERLPPGATPPAGPLASPPVMVCLPSGFGPYGLMRAAHQSGGRYVLWSWSDAPGLGVRYDYARVDALAPDLRPRAEILADVRRRPLGKAMLDAWHLLANSRVGIALQTAPLAPDLRRPFPLREVRGSGFLAFSWHAPRGRAEFVARATRARKALRAAILRLDRAIDGTEPVPDDVDRRYLADARLMRHVLRVHRFEIGEALAATRETPSNAWRDETRAPGVRQRVWILAGADPDTLRFGKHDPFDPRAAEEVRKERVFLLRTYAGTPHGEQVARNEVDTYRYKDVPYATGDPTSRQGPDTSDPDRGPVTPEGSGGTSGPSTGD